MTLEGWRAEVRRFVADALPPPPGRLLEVGCGEGWLSRSLARRGYDVTAIDPDAPKGSIFRRLKLEDLADDVGPFDSVVSSLALHHVHDLSRAVAKIHRLLDPAGMLVLVEFGWDRFDEPTARWCRERLRPDGGWLRGCCGDWAEDQLFEAHCRDWAEREGLHSSEAMLRALRTRFRTRLLEWVPYLYPDLDERTSADDERQAIDSGRIQAVGFRYVGERRAAPAPINLG